MYFHYRNAVTQFIIQWELSVVTAEILGEQRVFLRYEASTAAKLIKNLLVLSTISICLKLPTFQGPSASRSSGS
jgi:hypothetical protein